MTVHSEVAFIDPGVDEVEALLAALRPEVRPVMLHAAAPAARQMAQALEGCADLAAIHILAHGEAGRVRFAAGDWTAVGLSDEAANLAALGRALARDGDLRLWACHAGAGESGRAFVDVLGAMAGAAVAAASGLVGASKLGGEWSHSRENATARAPLSADGQASYAGIFAKHQLKVSGGIPSGRTTKTMTYFVIDKSSNSIVGNIMLPDAADFANRFEMTVEVPSASAVYDVGTFDDAGVFVSANFELKFPPPPTGAVGRE